MNNKYTIPVLLILLGVSTRLIPHPANFASITAIAIFGGIYLPKRTALTIPLVAMFTSDLIIGFYSLPILLSVYISFLAAGLIGLWIKNQKNLARIVGGTLASSILFFLVTNAAVCFFGTIYTHNLSGLLESYHMALPFFKNSLLSDFFYIGILVGGYEVIKILLPKPRTAAAVI